jgi:hypothetical protein
MRAIYFAFLAAAICYVMPTNASAERYVNISQRCNYDCLKSACANAGGHFSGDHTNYQCNNEKKGAYVGCTGTVCHGTVPIRGKGNNTITGILHGGSSPPAKVGDGNTKPLRHPINVNAPNKPISVGSPIGSRKGNAGGLNNGGGPRNH